MFCLVNMKLNLQFSGAEFCGNHIPRNFTTEENVTITLETDESARLQGFQIHWQMVDGMSAQKVKISVGSLGNYT